ncbi:hypothetical protein BDV39DRAFT_191211 [Aspergillus sergii]|uniref:NAD-dependent epimerase/dehydratase domain-containing protein n=1 Tax=Aspergillus sergii TaxID=1034303 RepID=A0A5N6X9P8_9EURO|nr:hypothetical protein BDV39DRAFT_191211 [Aspergillus sergii]
MTVTHSKTILITGASGFLATHIVKAFLQHAAAAEAVEGVDGIINTASPFQTSEYAPRVSRVVITSSMAAVIDTESAHGIVAYAASKAVAEKAAWRYMETNTPDFSLTTICPLMIYGPVEHHVSTMERLNTSAGDIYRLFNGSSTERPLAILPVFADVRDVAQAYLSAFESEKGAGERFIFSSGGYTYQEVCDILRSVAPEVRDKVPIGQPGKYGSAVIKVSNDKAKTLLGITVHTLQETVKDTAYSLLALEEAFKG